MAEGTVSAEKTLGSLSASKKELLALLREEKSKRAREISPVARVARDGKVRLPASWAQQRLWFIDQLEGGSAGYQVPLVFDLRGRLDVAALRAALDGLVQRHEVLRTVFVSIEGEPQQEILAPGTFGLQMMDLSGHGESQRHELLRVHKFAEVLDKFDLATGPLIRGRLLKLREDQHVLLVTMHHIITDGWSLGVFIREFAELYEAHCLGTRDPLRPLAIQYADYAQWQRLQWSRGSALERQLLYWRTRLEGAPPQLELPTDRPRPAVQTYRGGNAAVLLDAHLSARAKGFAQRNEMTLFMVLYAAWAILLHRLTGQEDLVIGMPIANRQRQEIEGLIGLFVNTLAIRIRVHGDMSLGDLLRQVKEATLGAYDHQGVPFERVVEALRPERSVSRNPLFQAMFVLHNEPRSELHMPGLDVRIEDNVDEPSILDLWMSLEERGEVIAGYVNYAADLFDRETVYRWITYYLVLVRGMTEGTQARIGDLPILPESERRQILESFNATAVTYPAGALIHRLFEEQVARTPDRLAAICDSDSLTYAELNRRANQLARYLLEHGVGPDQLVGLYVERGPDMIVGMLGILKAGGAYVPLDPAYPPERMTLMLKDAAPKVVLTQQRLKGRLPQLPLEVVAVDEHRQQIAAFPADNIDVDALGLRADHLAYVIYTSGSTGQPKGVAIEHRNSANLILWARDAMSADVFARTLQCTSLNFDLAVYECFVPLSVGGCLRIVENALVVGGEAVDVTLINTVPSAIAGVMDAGGIPSATRVVNLAGEPLKKEVVERIFAGSAVEQVCNLYGPTETTTYSTWISMPRTRGFLSSIGRPIANTQIYVLDRRRKIVPIGVVGEIYIGGAGVAREYLNRPELTAERFVADPFARDSRARMYKTGDLGRWRIDGTLEYLGRNDHQVKIRGYRIELGEIESQIAKHPQVKDTVVMAREDTEGQTRLVAYVVAKGSSDASVADEVVGNWESVWKETYRAGSDAGPQFVSWNSSYTGEAIPESEMQEWLEGTLARIRALKPKKVLEIGCGVGLLLQHVAPECEVYAGTDFSAAALEQLDRWRQTRAELRHVQLMHRTATELEDLGARSFDTVILNSVVQYFPDITYLLKVIEGAVRLLSPEGKLFIGDVRHLGLLSMFHSAVQLSKAAATVSVGQLKRRIARSLSQEKELVIDPRFFELLPGRVAGIGSAEVQVKRGWAANELTRYRYDVVLSRGAVARPEVARSHRFEWRKGVGSLRELEEMLESRNAVVLQVQGAPNARLASESVAQSLIESSEDLLTASAIRRQVQEHSNDDAMEPEQLWTLGQAHGYDVRVSWAGSSSPGNLDVQFVQQGVAGELPRVPCTSSLQPRPWDAYANNPSDAGLPHQLVPQLREHLKGRLPAHMIPADWILMKQLPLTPNGKVDRHALPASQEGRQELSDYVAPRTETERALAALWAQVLQVDQVGVQDNFFELGGHSLLGTRLIAKIAQQLRVTLSPIAVFRHPTVREMALALDAKRS